MNTDSRPKVSVLMVTYNHEPFIAQAIESALMQVTDFDYEIVIGEDGSQDRTPSLVREYAEKHPRKIRAFIHPRNLGPHPLGLRGRNNLIFTYKACQGQYLAFLDGDDYWTDEFKLQRQVDFLERHPECALSSHPAKVIYSDGRSEMWPPVIGASSKEVRPLEDILPLFHREENLELPVPSVMIREGIVEEFPDWFHDVFNHDIAIQWLAAEHGKIGFLGECMAVSRKHGGGLSRLYETDPDFCWDKFLKLHLSIDRHLNFKYHALIKNEIGEEWRYRAFACKRRREYLEALKALLRYLGMDLSGRGSWTQKIKTASRFFFQ